MTASALGSGPRRGRLARHTKLWPKLAVGVVVVIGWVTLVLMLMFMAWFWRSWAAAGP